MTTMDEETKQAMAKVLDEIRTATWTPASHQSFMDAFMALFDVSKTVAASTVWGMAASCNHGPPKSNDLARFGQRKEQVDELYDELVTTTRDV